MTVPLLETFGRDEFVAERFSYHPSEHVTVIGPTGTGKTHLVFQLMEKVATPQTPAVVLVKKPRDYLITKRGKELGFVTTKSWPPGPALFTPTRPPGWLVWPPTHFDPDRDRPAKSAVFRRALLDSYKRGKRLVWVDDAYGISELLKLREELIEMWTEMRSMDGSLWASFQKPSHVPLWAYSQASHLFLFNDPDKRSRERYGEIGGVDGKMIQETVMALKRHQCLYIRRAPLALCIVDR